MAQPRDYLKPRNQEMRDLLVHLPHPVKVLDPAGLLLWQNSASEALTEQPGWVQQPTTWQGKKAFLAIPELAPEKPSPLLGELELENERLRRHQRDTARRKKKAEDSAKQTEKAAGDLEKREQKLRQQLAAAEQKVAELEAASGPATSLDFAQPAEPTAPVGKGKKGKGKAKARGKAGQGSAGSHLNPVPDQPEQTQLQAGLETELRELQNSHSKLSNDLSELQKAESRWQDDRRLLEQRVAELVSQQDRLSQQYELSATAQAQLEEDKRQLEAWIEELEAESGSKGDGGVAAPEQIEALRQDFEAQLKVERRRYSQLEKEYEAFRRETDEAESQRQLEDQLAAKVREFEELERAFEEEQKAAVAQKQELLEQLSEQESEFSRLRQTLDDPNGQEPAPGPDSLELQNLREDLEEAKMTIAEANRREIRLAEKLEGANELRDEQSKVMALVKDELIELRTRERELKETLKLYGDFRQELEQARGDAKKYRAEAQELRQSQEKLEATLLESRRELSEARSQGAAGGKGLSLREPTAANDSGSTTVKSQLEFAQKRLRDTEKQLDEARGSLKKALSEAQGAKDTEKLAFQDSLTGLPNRHIVDRYLDFSNKQARSTNRAYSLFLIDIDGFRVLNETFGRDWGDSLLKAVGERLAGMRGPNHVFARHSQDRFLLLAADLEKPGAEKFVRDACKSLLDALSYPFEVKGEAIKLTGSIGAAIGPGSGEDPRELFDRAEIALASAKAQGANTHFLYNDAMQQKALRDATYLKQMEQAIERDEFRAVYQPIFNLQKGMTTGVELLLRWDHRDQRTLRPDEFLEVALSSGLIFKLADKIWPRAFKCLARWRRLRPGVTLSINLSDRELLSPKLVERALSCAKEASVEPSAILFEVRDASRLRFSATWWTVLGALHEAGFGLTLDDYGSEASLFGTLAYTGFRQAKIAVDEKNPVCTPAPNAAKGMLYCAKRIQTRFDQKALKKAGFDMAQGLAVARPLDEDDVDSVFS